MAETLKTSPSRTLFFNVIPTAAIAFAVAALVSPEPRSVPIIVILALTAVFLWFSAWRSYSDYRIVNEDQASRDEVRRVYSDEGERGRVIDLSNDDVETGADADADIVSSVQLYNVLQSVMRPSTSIITLLYGSSFTLTIVFLIRLFSVKQFGGYPQNLDYGPKISKNGPAGDTNIALEEFDFDTFAHFIQGVLSAFLSFPAVVGFLSNISTKVIRFVRICKRRSSSDAGGNVDTNTAGCFSSILLEKPCLASLSFLQLLCTCLTYYPFYSMIKRLRYSSFSQTSHLNNSTEWCAGFILGISLGSLVSSLIIHQFIIVASDTEGRGKVIDSLAVSDYIENGKKKYSFGNASDFKGVMKCAGSTLYPIVEYASLANLILLAITTLLTAVNIALSWNYEDKENTVNGGILALYICLYVIFYSIFFILARWN